MIQAGVVAVQGDVSEHAAAIRRAGESHSISVEIVEIRQSGVVPDCDVLWWRINGYFTVTRSGGNRY